MFDRTLLGLSNLSKSFGASLTLSNRPLRDDRRNTRQRFRASRPRPYLIRANAISSFAWPSTISVPFPGAHLAGLAEVISEQITMFVSPVKQESLKVALPWVNRTLPAQRLANTWRFPPPKGITPIDAGTCNRSIGAGGC